MDEFERDEVVAVVVMGFEGGWSWRMGREEHKTFFLSFCLCEHDLLVYFIFHFLNRMLL